MIGYEVSGHDNDTYFFRTRKDLAKCSACGYLLHKWDEPYCPPKRVPRKNDLGASYDGVEVGSDYFRQVYEKHKMTGLEFRPVCKGFWMLWPKKMIHVDVGASGIRLLNLCLTCGNYESILTGTSLMLCAGETIPPNGFVRTDLEFAGGDEKGPLILCGPKAGDSLLRAELIGAVLDPF